MSSGWPPEVINDQVIAPDHHNGLRDNVVRKKAALEGQLFFTQESVLFADSSGFLDEDNANLSWDSTLKRLSVGGGTVPTWRKFTIAEAALTGASTTEDEALFTASQLEKILGICIKHSAAFTGGGLSAMTVSIGLASDPTFYSDAQDIFQAAGDAVKLDMNTFGSQTMASAGHAVIARFTSTGADVVAATAGSVDIWILTSVMP